MLAAATPTVVFEPGSSLIGRPLLLWLLLLVPLVAAATWWLWSRRQRAERRWATRGLRDRLQPGASGPRRTLTAALLTLAVAGAALSLARPRWGAVEHRVERRGVDVVFVLDSSLSMGARDVAPSRLFVAKTLIRDLVRHMPSNRVGLIAAEGRGEVLTPLTLDGAVLDLLLDTVQPGSLPVPGTELGPSLVASVELFPPGETGHHAVILLSDGEDHGEGLEDAAERLAELSVVVHTIGIGTTSGSPVPLPGAALASRRRTGDGFKRDAEGQPVISRLGTAALQRTADLTGGVYVEAGSAAADTRSILGALGDLETKSLEGSVIETRQERFQWPLAAAALCLTLYLGVGANKPRSRSRPRGARA